jgi:hypothetical protein
MICEYYESEDGTEGCFSSIESFQQQPFLKIDTDGIPMKKLFEIEGNTWEECMTIYHERMGWEPYIPFDERC